jgi:hypothetical protein
MITAPICAAARPLKRAVIWLVWLTFMTAGIIAAIARKKWLVTGDW